MKWGHDDTKGAEGAGLFCFVFFVFWCFRLFDPTALSLALLASTPWAWGVVDYFWPVWLFLDICGVVWMHVLVVILGGYVLLGLVVGLGFVLRGVSRVDAVAGQSAFVFRLLILPGCIGLWPVVLGMWLKAGKGGAG